MTALTEQRILGIRSGDRVIVPPLEWDPDTGEELAHDFVEVGPAGTVESWTWVADADRAAPARPAVRVRAHPARRRRHVAAPRGRRRLDRRHGDRHAGRAPLAGRRASATSPTSRLRPRRGARGADGDDGGAAAEPVDDDGLQRVDHLHGARSRRTSTRAEQANDEGRFLGLKCPVCGRTYTGGQGLLPDRRARAHRRARGRPARSAARSPTTRSSRRCSTRARPRPSRSPGCTSCSTAPT